MKADLLTCPFCGDTFHKPYTSSLIVPHSAGYKLWYGYCPACNTTGPMDPDRQKAEDHWNRLSNTTGKLRRARGLIEALEASERALNNGLDSGVRNSAYHYKRAEKMKAALEELLDWSLKNDRVDRSLCKLEHDKDGWITIKLREALGIKPPDADGDRETE